MNTNIKYFKNSTNKGEDQRQANSQNMQLLKTTKYKYGKINTKLSIIK